MATYSVTVENKIVKINNVNCQFMVGHVPISFADLPDEFCIFNIPANTPINISLLSNIWGGDSPISTPQTYYSIDTTLSSVYWYADNYARWWLARNNSTVRGFASDVSAPSYTVLYVLHFEDDVYIPSLETVIPNTSTDSFTAPTSASYGFLGYVRDSDIGWGSTYKSNINDASLKAIGSDIMSKATDAPTDPYADAGDSGVGGGGGTFDPSGDDIPIPSLPTLSASDAGFITLFNPSVAQLNSLASYMWTNAAFDIANFKKIFEDPMDCILGLSIVPIAVSTSGSADVAIGNLLISSIQFPVVASQYQEFNCGTVTIPEFFGGYLDYEPYTKIQIVVPYCGTFQISADDVMGKTLQLVYHIDVLTGSCIAMLLCGTTVLYQFNGSCAVNIPINSINYASTIENATRIAVAIGTTVATAGAAAPAIAAGGESAGAAGATLFNSAVSAAGATAEGALSMKPSIERSGALSSSSGMMSVQTPYIVITRPRLCKPKDQDKIKGYPSFIETTVGALENRGYTEFDTVILNKIYLTDTEKGELDRILRGGVFL